MAPTTLIGQKSTTCPLGRNKTATGSPLRISELLATIDGAVFVERVSAHSPAEVRNARRSIKKAFQCQLDGLGFSIVEVLSTCPTNWNLSPVESFKWLVDNMIPYYPLGNFKMPKERD